MDHIRSNPLVQLAGVAVDSMQKKLLREGYELACHILDLKLIVFENWMRVVHDKIFWYGLK